MIRTVSHSFSEEHDSETLGQYFPFPFPLLLLRVNSSSEWEEEDFLLSFSSPSRFVRSQTDLPRPPRHNYLSCSTSPSAPLPPLPLLSHFTDESIWPGWPGSSATYISYQSTLSKNSTLYHCTHHQPTSPPVTDPISCWFNCKSKVNHVISSKWLSLVMWF